jgi:hypothetical protein
MEPDGLFPPGAFLVQQTQYDGSQAQDDNDASAARELSAVAAMMVGSMSQPGGWSLEPHGAWSKYDRQFSTNTLSLPGGAFAHWYAHWYA